MKHKLSIKNLKTEKFINNHNQAVLSETIKI